MKRKISTLPSKIWTFGCLPPTAEVERVWEQLRLAHRYYNALIEIERTRRKLYREERRRLCPALAACEERLEAIAAALEEARHRNVDTKEQRDALSRDKAERKSLGARAKKERAASKNVTELAECGKHINADANTRVRAAREVCGVYWGTYLLVEKAIEAAKKSAVDPKFKRWCGEGRIGVQIHHEKAAESAESTMLQIEKTTQSKNGRRQFGVVRVRVGSRDQSGAEVKKGGRYPIWAEFPIVLHRELPADATLTWGWIKFTRIGPRTRLELQLTVESESFAFSPTGRGTAALDLGWRKLGGLRVAYLVDQNGNHGEFRIPESIDDRLRQCAELSSVRDLAFDEVRKHLVEIKDALPDWAKDEIKFVANWKSPARLAMIVRRLVTESGVDLGDAWKMWRAERAGPGADYYAAWDVTAEWARARNLPPHLICLDWWRRQNNHLYSWIESQRTRALGHRDDLFAQWAAWITKSYENVAIEDFDLRGFASKLGKEYDGLPVEVATMLRRQRNTTAPGIFRAALVSAMGKARVEKVEMADSTRECHLCGHVNEWKNQAPLKLECGGCGKRWDQDENAARVLLSRFERGGGDETTGGARDSGDYAEEAAAE
jgi:hypothetical protein